MYVCMYVCMFPSLLRRLVLGTNGLSIGKIFFFSTSIEVMSTLRRCWSKKSAERIFDVDVIENQRIHIKP